MQKLIRVALLLASLPFLEIQTTGATVPEYLPFGQERSITNRAGQVRIISTWLDTSTDGITYSTDTVFGSYYNGPFDTISVSNAMVARIKTYLSGIDTTDPSLQNLFYRSGFEGLNETGVRISFLQTNYFQLTKHLDGSYSIPTEATALVLNPFQFTLMTVSVPSAQSLQILGHDSSGNTLTNAVWSPVETNTFRLPTKWVSSGSNGWAKVTLSDGQVSYYWLATGDRILPKIEVSGIGSGGGKLLTLLSEPYKALSLECSSDLRIWTHVSNIQSGERAKAIYEDTRPEALSNARYFYRFKIVTP
jgi:hypothetical protein